MQNLWYNNNVDLRIVTILDKLTIRKNYKGGDRLLEYIRVYLVTLAIFLIIDFFWLGLIAKNLYRAKLGFILKDKFDMKAAFIFYFIYVSGLVFFVIGRANSWQYALFAGMFFGITTYSTYNLTNLATLKNWPLSLSFYDISWGAFLCGATSLLSYLILF